MRRWLVLVIAVLGCRSKSEPKPKPAPGSTTAVAQADAAVAPQAPAVPPGGGWTPPKDSRTHSKTASLTLVGCGAIPPVPVMNVNDPDVPGEAAGYHQGVPLDTPLVRQPYGVPPAPLATPQVHAYLWESITDDKNKNTLDYDRIAVDAVLEHEDELVACAKGLYAAKPRFVGELFVEFKTAASGRVTVVDVRPESDTRDAFDEATPDCVKKAFGAVTFPTKVASKLRSNAMHVSFKPLHERKIEARPLPPKQHDDGGFTFQRDSPAPIRHAWTGSRYHDDGTRYAPAVMQLVRPKLDAMTKCLRELDAPLGSLHSLVKVYDTYIYAQTIGLGSPETEACVDRELANLAYTSDRKLADPAELGCDFVWGEAAALRATQSKYTVQVYIHGHEIEYDDRIYTAEHDMPMIGTQDTVLIIADANASGAAIKAALAHKPWGEAMFAIRVDEGPPVMVGRVPSGNFQPRQAARVGLQLVGGEVKTCVTTDKKAVPATDAAVEAAAKACEAATCEGAWIGVADGDRAESLLPAVALAWRRFGGATLGAPPCR